MSSILNINHSVDSRRSLSGNTRNNNQSSNVNSMSLQVLLSNKDSQLHDSATENKLALHKIISERDEVMSKAYMTLKESKDLHVYLKHLIQRDGSRERHSPAIVDISNNGLVQHQEQHGHTLVVEEPHHSEEEESHSHSEDHSAIEATVHNERHNEDSHLKHDHSVKQVSEVPSSHSSYQSSSSSEEEQQESEEQQEPSFYQNEDNSQQQHNLVNPHLHEFLENASPNMQIQSPPEMISHEHQTIFEHRPSITIEDTVEEHNEDTVEGHNHHEPIPDNNDEYDDEDSSSSSSEEQEEPPHSEAN